MTTLDLPCTTLQQILSCTLQQQKAPVHPNRRTGVQCSSTARNEGQQQGPPLVGCLRQDVGGEKAFVGGAHLHHEGVAPYLVELEQVPMG